MTTSDRLSDPQKSGGAQLSAVDPAVRPETRAKTVISRAIALTLIKVVMRTG
jgi:hypothetical protein